MNMEGGLNPKHWLFGSDIETLPKSAVAKHHYQHMSQFMHTWALDRNDNEFVDVMELCGGTARVSHLLIRRWHRKPYNVGKNFDAIVGYDLLDATQQACYWQYLKRTQPLVIIISTPCTGLMGWKHLNAIRAPETHARSRKVSLQLGHLGGETALHQLRHDRHFIAENPRGSDLYQIRPWMKVKRDPKVVSAIVDLCAADLKINRQFVKKTSELYASHEDLLEPVRDLVCNGQHVHIPLEGTWNGQPMTKLAQVWPWEFASRIASGVGTVVRKHYENLSKELYPTEEQKIPPPGERQRSNRFHWPCPACRTNMAKDHPRHTRHPEDCRWPCE